MRAPESAEKQHVDSSKSESQNCLIQGPGNASDKCKVLEDFGTKYARGKPSKDYGNNHVPRKKKTSSKKTTLLLTMLWIRSY